MRKEVRHSRSRCSALTHELLVVDHSGEDIASLLYLVMNFIQVSALQMSSSVQKLDYVPPLPRSLILVQ